MEWNNDNQTDYLTNLKQEFVNNFENVSARYDLDDDLKNQVRSGSFSLKLVERREMRFKSETIIDIEFDTGVIVEVAL